MQITLEVKYLQYYLPSKRHRKERRRIFSKEHAFTVPEANEFPVAFRITDYANVWDEKSKDCNYEVCTRDVRYDGSLWKVDRDNKGKPSVDTDIKKMLQYNLEVNGPKWYDVFDDSVSENLIYTHDDFDLRVMDFQKMIDSDFRIYDHYIWVPTGEPIYKIQTFGLGNNHGGTGFFVDHVFPEDRSILEDYEFPANMRDEAISYFEETARNRGDLKSLYKQVDTIEVLMPECINAEKFDTYMVEVQATYLVPMKAGCLESAKGKVSDELEWVDLNKMELKEKEVV